MEDPGRVYTISNAQSARQTVGMLFFVKRIVLFNNLINNTLIPLKLEFLLCLFYYLIIIIYILRQ